MHAPRIPTALSLLLAFAPATALAGPATTIGQLRAGAADPAEVAVTATVSADFREGLGGVFVQDGGDGDPATPDGLFVRPVEGVQFPEGVAAGQECRFQGRLF